MYIIDNFSLLNRDLHTVKAFAVTPQNDKKSIIMRGGYDKGY